MNGKKAIALMVAALIAPATSRGADGPPRTPEVYDITAGQPVGIAARKVGLPLLIYGESRGQSSTFVPSGYMGDATSVKLISAGFSAPLDTGKEGTTALKVKYTAKGPAGWAGIWWLTPANNWAKIKGAGYDLSGSPKLTFWAKGESGGERLSEIKIGGIVGPYPDTDTASLGTIRLTSEWKQYSIDLAGRDLRHIIGGFMFVIRRVDNPRGAIFYLDEMRFESPTVEPEKELDISVVDGPQDVQATISFPRGAVALGPDAAALLRPLVDAAKAQPAKRILVEGHSDNAGPEDINLRNSLERARAVSEYLRANGIQADRIDIKGFGSDRFKEHRVDAKLVDK